MAQMKGNGGKHLAKWIRADKISLLTGNFGKCNASGIEQTAVAAGASVGHQIANAFDYSQHDKNTPTGTMSGGLLVFAPHIGLREE